MTAEALIELRAKLAPIAKTLPPQSVLPRTDENGEASFASWDRQLVDPAIVELALELGVPLRIPAGEAEEYAFWLHTWSTRGAPEDSLARVIAHPWFGRVLRNSFFTTRETRKTAGNWLDRATRHDSFAPVFEALGPMIAKRVAAWTLGAFELHADWLESLCRPGLLRRIPGLIDVVRGLDMARMFGAQLRAGLVDEWGWPALDEALDKLGAKPEYDHSGPPPYLVFYSRERKRLVACGPDGIVFDRVYDAPYPDIRSFWFLDGDVLACSYPTKAQWVDAKIELDASPYGFYTIATRDGSAITKSGVRVKRGAAALPAETARGTERLWFDGTRYYGITSETSVGKDLSLRDPRVELFTFDPDTGKRGAPALPPWFASLLDDKSRLLVSSATPHLQPVPAVGETPLGTKDGLGGAALVQRGGRFECVGIDGRRGPGLVNGLPVGALMTFPERDGYYPIVMAGHDIGIAMPDGITPLVPMKFYGYWQMPAPQPMLAHWYSLRPRDPAGSRALAACTDATARAILDDDVRTSLPQITHPRLIAAITQLAERAHEHSAAIARIQGHLVTAVGAVESTFVNDDAKSLALLLDHGMHWWVEQNGIELGQQMLDVSRYLFGEEKRPATPARTAYPWDALFTRLGEVLYRALASGTPKEHRAQLVGVLRMWAQTKFPDHVDRMRLAVLTMPKDSPLLRGIDRDHRDRLVAFENRYFLRRRDNHNPDVPVGVHALEAARDGTFRVLRGSTIVEEIAIDRRFGRAAIDAALKLAAERERVEVDAAFIEHIVKETGLSPTAATLVWAAGYEPWLVGEKARERLRIDRSALDKAEREIKGRPFAAIYRRAMPADPAHMFTLEGAASLARAWNELARG